MDANKTPGRTYKGLRIAGVNAPGVPELKGITQQAVPEQVDITTEKFTQMGEDVQRGYQAVLDTLRVRGQAKAAELEAQGRTPRQSALAGLAETAVKAFVTVKEAQDRKKSEEAKAAQELGEQQAWSLLDTTLAELDSGIIETADVEGINTVEADARRVIREATAGLAPSVRQTLERHLSDRLSSARQRSNTRLYENQREIRQAAINQKKADLTARTMGFASAIEFAPDASSVAGYLDEAFTLIGQQTQNMDLAARLEIAAALTTTLTESIELSSDKQQEVARRQAGIAELQQRLPALQEQYAQDPNGLRLAIESLTSQYGISDLAGSIQSTREINNMFRQDQMDEWSYREALIDQQTQAFARAFPQFSDDMAQVMAFDMLSDIQLRSRVEALGDDAAPHEKQALRIYQSYEDMREQYQNDMAEWGRMNSSVEQMVRMRNPAALGNTRYQFDNIEREWVPMPVSAILNTPQAVSSAGGVASFAATVNSFLGGGRETVNGQEVLYVAPGVSAEEVAAQVQQRIILENRIQSNRSRAQSQGFDPTNPANTEFIDPIRQRYEAGRTQVQQMRETQGSVLPNFNSGGVSAPATPPVQPLAQVNGHVTPFPASAQVSITSGYGMRVHPVHGTRRPHHGIDIVGRGQNGEQVLAVQGGRVIRASEWSGYGGTVLVQTPDGRVEQYSHLREFTVREGQTIPPGTRVGTMGGGDNDPMRGTSTGRHLHFQVWKANPDYGSPTRDTISPLEYLESIQYNQRVPPGVGLPPTQAGATGNMAPVGNDRTATGNYQVPILPGVPTYLYDPETRQSVTTRQVFTPANPRRTAMAPINRSAYPARANPTHNYGYSVIARDSDFARSIADLANHLNIPGQWLADVMAYEVGSSFNPRRAGGDRNAYHGLIQISEANLRNMGLTVYDLRNMSRADYVRRVAKPYFEEFRGRINTIEDLYAAVLGGSRLFRRSPQERGSIGDSNNSFSNHVRRIGHHVGRRYRTSYDANLTSSLPVHTHTTQGCPICTTQSQTSGYITPHQGVIG